jgi:enoyl-CoA hydratase/carnithine racemase
VDLVVAVDVVGYYRRVSAMIEAYEDIHYALNDAIALITLDRPERLNAWTAAMQRSVKRAVLAAARDQTVRVIVVTGAGRAFCAGADMGLLNSVSRGASQGLSSALEDEPDPIAPADLDPELALRGAGRFGYMLSVPKPIIAAVNGPCAGIGFAFSLFCDLRFASERALFITAFSQRGLIAEHGASWMLPRIVGPAHALDLLLSSRRVAGTEAERLGLVNKAFPHETFMNDVLAYALHLAQAVSPRSMAVIKAQIWKGLSQELGPALELADREMQKSFESADFKEGIAHFVEKRPARFTGL